MVLSTCMSKSHYLQIHTIQDIPSMLAMRLIRHKCMFKMLSVDNVCFNVCCKICMNTSSLHHLADSVLIHSFL